jgi:hypothetical protein
MPVSEFEEILNIAMEGSELHFLSKLNELVPSPWTAMFRILGCLRVKIGGSQLGAGEVVFGILC